MRYFCYDLETLINFFSFTGKFVDENSYYSFEISTRKNQRDQLVALLNDLAAKDVVMVGYNSLGFDYPIIHDLLSQSYTFDYTRAYNLCQEIINGQSHGQAGRHSIRPNNRFIRQLDLVKLNHFDNANKRVPLKMLQFAMRSESVEDMPVELGKPISEEQMDMVLKYNLHDVTETEKFFLKCKGLVDLRLDLIQDGVLFGDVLNYSDVKIGQEYLVNKIGRNKCYNGYEPKQSMRSRIIFKDLVAPTVKFMTSEFDKVLEWFKSLEMNLNYSETKPKLVTKLAGIDFTFGLGGVHASVNNKVYRASETHKILDVDVSGMYVAVAISNGFYPEHLGEDFTVAYKQLQADRRQYPKGTTMNGVLKLAGNGVYGNSNNPYSPFYDPKYTFTVTMNGQLQLLMLVEMLSLIPGVEIIQANTDGITLYYPNEAEQWIQVWCKAWEKDVRLKLEHVDYDGMWIADVNNYIARTVDGKIKRKGKYWFPENDNDYEGQWHKDFSNMVVPKIASAVMLDGWDPSVLMKLSTNPFDFMARYRATGDSKIFIGDKLQQRTVRYYVSKSGDEMYKKAPPKGELGTYKRKNKISDSMWSKILSEIPEGAWDERIHTKNKSKYTEAVTGINSGRKVKECNVAKDFNWSDVDYDFYLKEVEKLVIR